MLAIFRAFLWMRWRVLANTLERTGARDALDRLSLATEKLGPLIAIALLVPSAVAMFVVGLVAGFGIATGSGTIPFQIVRFFLLAGILLTLLGPIILPARDSASAVRLLLLPTSRGALYLSQLVGSLDRAGDTAQALRSSGLSLDGINAMLDRLLQGQS